MSMGPAKKDEEVKETKLSKFSFKAKKFTKEAVLRYFDDPLVFLLYTGLPIFIAGIFIGAEFHWQAYAMMSILSGIEIYRNWYLKK